ncbi:MAG: amidoligase family protein, partial [Hominimerdicola sp.]
CISYTLFYHIFSMWTSSECDCCGERYFNSNSRSDENIKICENCFENHYYCCTECSCLIYSEDVNWSNDESYCDDCYDDCRQGPIHDYSYKPIPIFFKCSDEENVRYYGVELEIDEGGKDNDNAVEIYDTANINDNVIYIKSDGSLEEGMELVSYPCSLKYHRFALPWSDIMHRAKSLHYLSHNTSTCGLHVHIGRKELGETEDQQEEVISRIMFFFESHWNELFKFSRRSEYNLERWASRYGYKDKPKEILEDAKKNTKGRYACINITNSNTVEIRMFRGTLKWNTFMACLELVDAVCENALKLTDNQIHKQSWNDFVISLDEGYTELVKYLKEKRLYVNEPVNQEEDD